MNIKSTSVKKMWVHVILIQNFFQGLRPLKVEYSQDRRFHENVSWKQKIISLLLDLNLVLFFFMSLVGLQQFLFESSQINVEREGVKKLILKGVLQLLFVGCSFAILPAAWTLRYRPQETVWMLNQALAFYQKREQAKTGHAKEKYAALLFSVVTWSTVVAVSLGCLTLTLTPLIYNATPAHIFLSIFWKTSERSVAKTVTCLIYLGIVYLYGGTLVCAPGLVYTCSANYETLFLLPNHADYYKKPYTFRKEAKRYQNAYLFIRSFNQFGFAFWPVLMTAGFCINVATSFVCIKYHASMSSLLVGMFVVFDLSVIVVTVGLHTFSVICLEDSKKFMKFWRPKIKRRIELMQMKSFPRILVRIGSFFNMERKVILITFDQVVDQTVNLLIMDS